MHEKDPFGDKLKEKERAEEDLYFAKRDRELLERLKLKDDSNREAALRELARGRCPKCGNRLTARAVDGVAVEECTSCGGVWLDRGELASVSRRESETWLARLFRNSLIQTR
jgi:Transcription factor zinc-finger